MAQTSESARLQVVKRTRHEEPVISWAFAPRIEPGEYRAFARSAAIYRDKGFKRWVCVVQFDVMNDSLTEVAARLTWYLNLGSRERPHVGRRGNYWPAWVKANGGPPKRRDRLSPRIFERRLARVRVEDTAKDHKQNQLGAEDAYSVVRTVLEWETGEPSR